MDLFNYSGDRADSEVYAINITKFGSLLVYDVLLSNGVVALTHHMSDNEF